MGGESYEGGDYSDQLGSSDPIEDDDAFKKATDSSNSLDALME
jgi:hypothetical protein